MDPTKKIGKIKEQVERENNARRRFPDKWGKLVEKDVNRFYNQNEVNKAVRAMLSTDSRARDLWSYEYTGHGDSYFVSKDMYESLVAKCRCGRPRTDGHIIKCLQRVQSKYSNNVEDDEDDEDTVPASSPSTAAGDGKRIHGKHRNGSAAANGLDDGGRGRRRRIPETSNGMIGWLNKCKYSKWEQSAKYVSPTATMIGPRVTARPYTVLFIG